MRSASSQNYDGGLPRTPRPKLTLNGRPAVAGPSRGRHPSHGIGARTSLHYCACGAKKRQGVCPRCGVDDICVEQPTDRERRAHRARGAS